MTLLKSVIGDKAFEAMAGDPVIFVRMFDREPWPYQADALRQILHRDNGRFEKSTAIVSLPRQNGKSTISAWAACHRFFCDPEHQEIISVALDKESARIILNDARRIIKRSDVLFNLIDPQWGLTKTEIRLRDERRWLIKSADAVYSRGLRPTMICYDEMGWAADAELFHVLSAGQAAAIDPLMLITTTVGPIRDGMLWELFQAHEAGDPSIRLIYETVNKSPLITEEFLEKQRRVLPAPIYAREHQNLWGEGSDVYCTAEDWERALEGGDPRRDADPGPCVLFVDLGWVHDETVIAVAKREDDRAVVVALEVFKGSKAAPVRFAAVESKIGELIEAFNVKHVVIESPQGVALSQRLKFPGVKVEVLHPTAKSNQERWGRLYTSLKNGSVWLPKDSILRRQLLTLTIKVLAAGWKVVDVPSIHNDRAVSVAGAVYMIRQELPKAKAVRLGGRQPGSRLPPTVTIRCPSCRRPLMVSRDNHQQVGRCRCGNPIDIPAQIERVRTG